MQGVALVFKYHTWGEFHHLRGSQHSSGYQIVSGLPVSYWHCKLSGWGMVSWRFFSFSILILLMRGFLVWEGLVLTGVLLILFTSPFHLQDTSSIGPLTKGIENNIPLRTIYWLVDIHSLILYFCFSESPFLFFSFCFSPVTYGFALSVLSSPVC